MWKGRKIVAVTPAGRRRYMELLKKQLEKYREVLDEWQVWKNTTDSDDVEYIEALKSDFVRVIECPTSVDGNRSINSFFQSCDDPGAIYVRFDDDVIVLDSLDAFKRFLDFRIDNPEYPIVYANILNNAIVTWVQQKHGNLPGETGYECMDPIAWGDPEFAKKVHDTVLENTRDLRRFYFENWHLRNYERVSINCISWIGTLDVPREGDEELHISVELPRGLGKHNCVFGEYCVVHFAFFTQRAELERAGYLERYRRRSS